MIHTGNGIIPPPSRPLIENLLCRYISIFTKEFKIVFKTENGSIYPTSRSLIKKLFLEHLLYIYQDLKFSLQNRRWNYPNRKSNYFSHFQASDQKTYFTTSFSYLPRSFKFIFKTGNGIVYPISHF